MSYISAKTECILVFIILALIPHWSYQAPQDAADVEKCYTPNNEVGSCVRREDCRSLVTLEQRFPPTDKRVSAFLKQSLCKNEGWSCCSNKELQNSTQSLSADENNDLMTPAPTVSSNNLNLDEMRIKLLPPDCGKRTAPPLRSRITGGDPAVLGEYPWIVALGFRHPHINASDAVPQWNCGGSLITARHVLTAAHCHHNDKGLIMYIARVGELNLDETNNDGATPEDILLKKVVSHPNHVRGDLTDDIAVAVLERSVTFSRNVAPICLPVSRDTRHQIFQGAEAHIAGWGSVTHNGPLVPDLRRAQVSVVPNDEVCKPRYAVDKRAVIDNRIICAGVESGDFDACQGDSGGPLMTELNNTFNLIGVVSYGDKCGESHTPGVYTRVTTFLDWILQTVEAEST